jgi:hypothetical protein
MYNLIFVDAGYGTNIPTLVHKMNVINGDHIGCDHLTGNLDMQIDQLVRLIEKGKPDKIIFDKKGAGYIFYQIFMEKIKRRPARDLFTIDAFGLIMYKGRDYGEYEKNS